MFIVHCAKCPTDTGSGDFYTVCLIMSSLFAMTGFFKCLRTPNCGDDVRFSVKKATRVVSLFRNFAAVVYYREEKNVERILRGSVWQFKERICVHEMCASVTYCVLVEERALETPV